MTVDNRDPLSHAILGAAIEVANTLGHGFLEAVYRRALQEELGRQGLRAETEVPFQVTYKGVDVGRYIADLVVERRMVVELKCADSIASAHIAQTLNYLKASRLQTALLLNFGKIRVEYRRFAL